MISRGMWVLALFACEDPPPDAPPPAALGAVPPPPGEAAPDPATAILTLPPTSGQQCRDDHDCPASPEGRAGHCLCTLPIPDGPVEATGLCWNGRVKTQAWWCTVQDGHAFLHGLFVPE